MTGGPKKARRPDWPALRHQLNRAVSQFPQPTDPALAVAWWRAKNVVANLGITLQALAEPERYRDVGDRVKALDAAYRAIVLHGEAPETAGAMELIEAIRLAAAGVLHKRGRLEDVESPGPLFHVPNSVRTAGNGPAAFRAAVEATVRSEQAMRAGRGRPPDRWKATFACVKSYGLASGIRDAANLRRAWQRTRPGALSLGDL